MPINSENDTELWESIQILVAKEIKHRKEELVRSQASARSLTLLISQPPRPCLPWLIRGGDTQTAVSGGTCHALCTSRR